MEKNNSQVKKDELLKQLPPLVADSKYYKSLSAHKHLPLRKELCEEIAAIEFPKHEAVVWKYRFLDPVKNIPKSDIKRTSIVMQEFLARKLQEQKVLFAAEVNKIDKKIEELNNAKLDLIERKKIGEEAIRIYKEYTDNETI